LHLKQSSVCISFYFVSNVDLGGTLLTALLMLKSTGVVKENWDTELIDIFDCTKSSSVIFSLVVVWFGWKTCTFYLSFLSNSVGWRN